MDDRALDVRVAANHHVGSQHGVGTQVRARFDPAVVADERGPLDSGVGVDLRPLPHPQALRHPEAGHVDLDLAVEDVLMGLHVGLERAHILPVAVGHVAEERLAVCEQLREHVAREVVGLPFGDVVEDLRLQDVDPGVDGVAEDLTPRRLLEEALDRPVVARDHDAELERVLHRLQRDRRHGLALLVEAHDLGQVEVGEHVAGDHEEGLVELVLGVAHRARGPER